jgi:hypothetical protein
MEKVDGHRDCVDDDRTMARPVGDGLEVRVQRNKTESIKGPFLSELEGEGRNAGKLGNYK